MYKEKRKKYAPNRKEEEPQIPVGDFSMPNEILTNILKYLPLDDIKACRLVNRQWRDSCSRKIITDKEKFVFHFGLLSVDEVNTLLVNLCKFTLVTIEFINFPLEELDFQKYGHNISSLVLNGCSTTLVITLKNLFRYMPNLCIFKCLRLYITGSTNIWKPSSSSSDAETDVRWDPFFQTVITSRFLLEVVDNLFNDDFRNNNMKQFEFSDLDDTTCQTVFVLKKLFWIFPNIDGIHLRRWPIRARNTTYVECPPAIRTSEGIIDMVQNKLENLTLEPTLKELSLCFMNFEDERTEANFYFSFTKLKSLNIILYMDENNAFFNSCIVLFSQQTELEELSVEYKYLRDIFNTRTHRLPHQQLLFHILNSCKKLQSLRYKLNCARPYLFKDHSITKEFVRLIRVSMLKELVIGNIEMPAFPMVHPDSKGTLNLKKLISGSPLASTRVLIRESNLEYLKITIERETKVHFEPTKPWLATLADILKDQKDLHTFKILFPGEQNFDDVRIFECPGLIKHGKLRLLKIELQWSPKEKWFNSLVNFLCSCEFENLHIFNIMIRGSTGENESGDSSDSDEEEFLPAMKKLSDWLTNMRNLTSIQLFNCCLSLDICLSVCSSLKQLQTVVWSTSTAIQHRKIVQIFKLCPTLKFLGVCVSSFSRCQSNDLFYYCKSKQKLFVKRKSERSFSVVVDVES